MSAHTPGPWEPCVLDRQLSEIPSYVETCIAASGGKDFLFVSGWREDGEVDICHVGNGPRSLANARLIAAAPDLLAALQALVAELDGPGKPDSSDSYAPEHFVTAAKAAIAKVEGGVQ